MRSSSGTLKSAKTCRFSGLKAEFKSGVDNTTAETTCIKNKPDLTKKHTIMMMRKDIFYQLSHDQTHASA